MLCAEGSFFQNHGVVCHLYKIAGSFGTNKNGLDLQLVSCQMDVVEAALRHQPKLSEEAGRVVHRSGGELTPLTQLCTPATSKAVSKVSESYR